MRDWLKNILMQLYEPNPEHDGYLNEKQRNKVSYAQAVCPEGLRKKRCQNRGGEGVTSLGR